jgi:hypothetical protein
LPATRSRAADVPGFTFRRDQNGTVIARCVVCSVGFVVREDHADNVRRLMNVHQLHVCKPSTERRSEGGYGVVGCLK